MADRETTLLNTVEDFTVKLEDGRIVPVVLANDIDSPYPYTKRSLEEQQQILLDSVNQGIRDLWQFEVFEKEQLQKTSTEKIEIEHSIALKLDDLYSAKNKLDTDQTETDEKRLEKEQTMHKLGIEELALMQRLERELLDCEKKHNQIVDLKLISIAFKLGPLKYNKEKTSIELNPEVRKIFAEKANSVFTPKSKEIMEARETATFINLFTYNYLYSMIGNALSTPVYSFRGIDIAKNGIVEQVLEKIIAPDNKIQKMFYLLMDTITDNSDGFIRIFNEFDRNLFFRVNSSTPETILKALADFMPFCNAATYNNNISDAYHNLSNFGDRLRQAYDVAMDFCQKKVVES